MFDAIAGELTARPEIKSAATNPARYRWAIERSSRLTPVDGYLAQLGEGASRVRFFDEFRRRLKTAREATSRLEDDGRFWRCALEGCRHWGGDAMVETFAQLDEL